MIQGLPDRDLMGIEHQLITDLVISWESSTNFLLGTSAMDNLIRIFHKQTVSNRPKLSNGGTECVCPSYSMKLMLLLLGAGLDGKYNSGRVFEMGNTA